MATLPDYFYNPVYGIDEYDALEVPSSAQLGGGAKVSADNLLTTLWTDIGFDGNGIPISGQLVKPGYAFGGDWFSQFIVGPQAAPDNIYDWPNVGLKSNMKSRVASRFYLDYGAKDPLTLPVVAFVKPPQELRQALANALSVDDDGNAVVKKPLLDVYTWDVRGYESDQLGSNYGPIGLTAIASGFVSYAPYYVGDGADGVFPTPLTDGYLDVLFGTGDMPTLIAALLSGDFTVAIQIYPDTSPSVITIEWPHSAARN